MKENWMYFNCQHSLLIYLPGTGPPGAWLENGSCLCDLIQLLLGTYLLDWTGLSWAELFFS